MVAAIWYHTCALKNDGLVVCWGDNDYGQSTVPAGLNGVIQVAGGEFHSCALKSDGTVACWGSNSSGQTSVPLGLSGVVQIMGGGSHNCALKSDATVVCWGYNFSGPTTVPADLGPVSQLSDGAYHTCVLKTDRTVRCWGSNVSGQTNVPSGLTDVEQLSGDTYTVCSLKSDGSIVCWGANGSGQADPPAGLSGVVQIAPGHDHTCVRKSGGTVQCWGSGSWGQTNVPAGLSDVTQINSGIRHSCVVKSDGNVVCWGYGSQTVVPTGLNLNVLQAQAIAFTSTPPSPAAVGETYTVSASGGGSGLAVVFSSLTASVCSVAQNIVSLSSIGTCTVAADQAAGPGYRAAPQVTQSFSVVGRQTVTFTSTPPAPGVVGTTYSLSATGGGSGSAVTFSTLTATICSVAGSTASLIHAGTCTVAADQAGGTGYLAAPQATQSFTVVDPQPQAINFTSTPPDPAVISGSYTVTALGGASGNSVLFSSLTPSVCFVIGNTVSLVTRGTCRVAADQNGNTYYLPAAQAVQIFDIYDVQAIAFTSTAPDPGVVGGTYSAAASGGLSGNPVTFSSLSTGVCTVSGSTASLTGAGTCVIAADQAAGGGYLAAPRKTQRFTVVAPIPQTITFASTPPNPALVGGSYTVTASGGASGNPVLFSSLTPSVCFVIGNTASFVTRGTCHVAADQTGNTYYLPGVQATQTFDINDVQAITFASTPTDPGFVGETYSVTAAGGLSGNPVTFSSLSTTICTVSGGTATLIHAGTCTVAADQAAGNGYLAAPRASQSFSVVDPQRQTINFTSSPPNPGVVAGTYSVSATGGLSGNAVTFSSLSTGVCTVSGSTTTLIHAGTCTVAADQAGIRGYLAANQASQSFSVVDPQPQSINFTSSPPDPALVGGSYAVAALGGGSSNPVLFSSLTAAICSVLGNTVSFTTRGTCRVAADQGGNTYYLRAPQVTQTFDIYDVQAVAFTSSPPDPGVVGGTYSVGATGGLSGNSVTFSSLSTGVCTVSGSTATLTHAGTCTIAADQAAGGGYLAAPRQTQNFTVVAPIPQVISFTSTPPNPAIVGGSYTVSASGGASGNSVLFSSLTPTVCFVIGNTVSLGTRGTCRVAADQTGNTYYLNADQKTQIFDIYDVQAITFTSAPTDPSFVGETYSVTAAGGLSGNAVTFSSLSTGVCTVSGSTATLIHAGTCTVAADQVAGNGYLAAPRASQSFSVVDPQRQTINFTSSPPNPGVVGGGTYSVSATGGLSGNSVTFSSLSTGVCTVSGNTATLIHAGTCTVAADQAGIRGYLAANQASQSFSVVDPIPQTITFASTPPNPAIVSGSYSLTASGGASGNPVLYSSLTPTICFVIGNTASLVTRGTCRVAADQNGNTYYLPAGQATQTFDIYDVQAITFTSTPPDPGVVGGTYSVTATGGLSGNLVTFTSLSTSVCSVSGSTASLTGAGTCVIAADQADGGGYLAAPRQTQRVTVIERQPQGISFSSSPPNPAIVGGSYTVTASGGGSGNPVLFSSLSPSVCFVIGNTVSLNARGTCNVAADQTGNTYYLPAVQATQTFDIYDVQAITFTSSPPSPGSVGGSYSIAATGGLSGNPVTFSSLSAGVCTVSGTTAALTAAGTCVIAADQAAGSGYLAAPRKTQSFTVTDRVPQAITFTSTPPNPPIVGGAYTVTATGGASGNPVAFSSLTPGTCGISGAMVSFTAAGGCTIAANQAGNSTYLPANQVTQSFVVDTRPMANAGSAQTGYEGSAVTFNAAGSSDADGDALISYNWNFGDGTSQSVTTATVQHVYNDNSASAYVVTLTVTDARGATSSPATTSALISNVAPTITILSAPANGKLNVDYTIQFRFSDPGTTDSPWSYQTTWGDGKKTALTAATTQGLVITQTTRYALPGTFTITVRVTDKDGATATATMQVTITRPLPSPGG